jgi:hypothetical protein
LVLLELVTLDFHLIYGPVGKESYELCGSLR